MTRFSYNDRDLTREYLWMSRSQIAQCKFPVQRWWPRYAFLVSTAVHVGVLQWDICGTDGVGGSASNNSDNDEILLDML